MRVECVCTGGREMELHTAVFFDGLFSFVFDLVCRYVAAVLPEGCCSEQPLSLILDRLTGMIDRFQFSVPISAFHTNLCCCCSITLHYAAVPSSRACATKRSYL